ncbi:Uncharacterized protein GBIM_21079 [Gryllus bimaculatus]|nr:Uncharacterized protein GBIM_21079 [Gryllus bimaculatus]
MEDLRPAGFRLADRKRGLGLRHSLLALRGLARFHAASHALLRQRPELERALDNMLNVSDQGHQDFVKGELEATALACRSWPGFQEIAERLDKFKTISGVVFDKINAPEPGGFNVISHGDFWTNNLMFRYEDGNPEEFRAVDLQLAHVCSPVIDILHLFSNSVSDNVHAHHQDLLLREYHVELRHTLEILGHKAPSLESLQAAMEACGSYALYFALELPIVKADEGLDLDAVSRGDYTDLLRVLETPDIKKRLQRSLQEYARKGWLPA